MVVVTINKDVQGGTPCFAGTRVPVAVLFDRLLKGYTIGEFLADFPTVPRALVEGALGLASADVPGHAVRVGEA